MPDERIFTCDGCGRVCMSDLPEEAAVAEAAANFPGHKVEDMAILCEDCFRRMMGPATDP